MLKIINEIQQPRPFDLVGNPLLIAGIGTGFEATLQYRVEEGHDERSGFVTVGGGTGEHDQFQVSVDLTGAAFMLSRLFVEIFDLDPQHGEINKVMVPVIYGPLIVPNYIGFRLHEVESGDTLSALAQQHYGDTSLFHRIASANPNLISDPNRIFVGQLLKIPVGA
jgi:Immunoglobulin-like domain of bacterial spore germination/LysM domain